MPYTRVTRTAFGADALKYVLDDKGHNGAEKRNEIVTPIKMHRGASYEMQMEKYWNKARSNHKTQMIRIVQSFSKNELDPDNPADIQKANVIGQELVDKHYPDRQALVCTQIDGVGRCVHNHIFINDVSMIGNKACDKKQYFHPVLRMWSDEITSQYIEHDIGNTEPERLTRTERRKREKGEYSYKDDLKKRITSAMELALSEDDFIEKLNENGVSVVKKNSTTYGEYYLYELTDKSTIPRDAKIPNYALHSRSYKLGTDYGPLALMSHIEMNKCEAYISKTSESDKEIAPKISGTKSETSENTTEKASEKITPVTSFEQEFDIFYAAIQKVISEMEDEEKDEEVTNEEIIVEAKKIADSAEDIKKKSPKTDEQISTRANENESVQINRNRFDRPLYNGFDNGAFEDDEGLEIG